ncbi:hypothetical protein [Staphylococcus phage vB_StaM_PB50]|nr:hypothetical protein [Staphylococcus phage vB_StaM_PB50]
MIENISIEESFLNEELEIVTEAISMNEAVQEVVKDNKDSNIKKMVKKLKEFFIKIVKAVQEAMKKFSTFFVAHFGKVTKLHNLAATVLAKLKKDKKLLADFVASKSEMKIPVGKLAKSENYKKLKDLSNKIYSDDFDKEYGELRNNSASEADDRIALGNLENVETLLKQSEQLVTFSKESARICKKLKDDIQKDSKTAISEIKELEKGKTDRKEKINEQKAYVTRANKLFSMNRQASTQFLKQDYILSNIIVNFGVSVKLVETENAQRNKAFQ